MTQTKSDVAFARVRRESPPGRHALWLVIGVISGLLAPSLMLLLGVMAWFLAEKQLPENLLPLGRFLSLPIPMWLSSMRPVGQLFTLVGIGVVLALLQSLTVWISYRGVLQRTGEALDRLHMRMLQRTLDRSQDEGVASQRAKASQLIEQALPQLRVGLIAWWRAIPRSAVLLVACLALAILVDPWLTLLAGVAGLLIWRLVWWLNDDEQDRSSDWELPDTQKHLVDLLQQAPLLARIQPTRGIDQLVASHLKTMRQLQQRIDGRWANSTPIIGLAVGFAIALLALVLGGSLLDSDSGMSLPAAMVLVMCVFGAAAAGARLMVLWQELGPARRAAETVFSFLDYHPSQPSSVLVGLPAVRDSVKFDRVSLTDAAGQPLLDRVSLQMRPGEVIALLGVEPVGLRSLVEMLMGYGRPVSGRLAFDGINVGDIHPTSLAKQVFWVAEDGPLWTGTVEDNLRAGGEATLDRILTVCRSLGLYNHLQMLPEGVSTVISEGEARFSPTVAYAIGLARAIVKQPAVVVLQEPPRDPAEGEEDLVSNGIQQLANTGCIVVVLPRRVTTLRKADRVVLIHHGRVEVEGTHQQLLESNDLYRHLNYLLFNPYRQLSDGHLR